MPYKEYIKCCLISESVAGSQEELKVTSFDTCVRSFSSVVYCCFWSFDPVPYQDKPTNVET